MPERRPALLVTLPLFLVAMASAQAAYPQDTTAAGDAPDPQQDSTWTRDFFEVALRGYYMGSRVRYGGETTGDRIGCHAELGQGCFGGDIDALVCPHGMRECVPDDPEGDRELMMSEVMDGLARLPGDPFIVGQAVYALTKFGRANEALDIARDCRTEAWWCALLEGHVLYETDRHAEAGDVFERALSSMPAEERCAWNDIMPLLPSAVRVDYLATPCADRARLQEMAWWLADPSWLLEGNERRTGHYARKAHIRLHEELWSLSRGLSLRTGNRSGGGMYDQQADWREYPAFDGHNVHHALDELFGGGHKGVVAIGFQDSWSHDGEISDHENREAHWRLFVSRAGARYRFFPDSAALSSPLSTTKSSWKLNDPDAWERFSTRRTVAGLDHQVVWFRRADSAAVVASTEIDHDERFGEADRWAGWILHREALGSPLRFVSRPSRERYTFEADLGDRPYLMGLEVIGPSHMARARYTMSPPWADDAPGPVSVSGLMLFRPIGSALPESYREAVASIRGSARWETGDQVGVFWEYYGLIPGSEARVAVRMIAVEDGQPNARGVEPLVSWTDLADRALPIFPRAIVLNLGLLDPGEYVLEFTISVPGQRPLVRTSPVILESPPGG